MPNGEVPERLFKDNEDFFRSLNKGIEVVSGDDYKQTPSPEDQEVLKNLVAVFCTATVSMDPGALQAPDLPHKLTAVRMALLTAYNIGRKSALTRT